VQSSPLCQKQTKMNKNPSCCWE